ncbi:Translationally-controlled tumor protein-like [Hondaea fermentalgiana]|uniref:Translationally-controlled tumor protein-like n=1 Tax=Hondaea fermentalgiana TaxID=2315210 RepID=A0A2R5GEN3_9STRA|nr:Translationally-controlled tumor protein-like [Hondaea fermentalgiana]|eukprot:GBG26691.1 Translationally-controlled tumor protein-like [Hondaea fermentalgiana]
MIVYTDIASGDQVLSDSYVQEPLKFNGAELEGLTVVQSKMINKDVGDIDIGANASAEEADAGTDDAAQMVNQLVDKETGFSYEGPIELKKAEFAVMYKKFCKDTKDKIVEKGDKPGPFMKSAKAFLELLNAEFKNFEIYQTSSFTSPVVAWWDDQANELGAPKFIYFTHAMIAEKY